MDFDGFAWIWMYMGWPRGSGIHLEPRVNESIAAPEQQGIQILLLILKLQYNHSWYYLHNNESKTKKGITYRML